MSPSRLVFALHFHQPYGNLESVFEDAYRRCYLPTLELLSTHRRIRAALHVSGPLLDWLERRRRPFLRLLASLVALGRVEILGGGHEEPILGILPDRDALAQLVSMADRCEALFGARPRGLWLAERVWEPDLPRLLARAEYRYVFVDDSHLLAAGQSEPLDSHYVTDKAGAPISVLPISKHYRQQIPFGSVEAVVEQLEREGRTVIYGDDVEKFGLWPSTERRVWHELWLARLFKAIEHREGRLATVLPSEVLDGEPNGGNVYLPTLSYAELGAWSLPTPAALALTRLTKALTTAHLDAAAAPFVRGGIWQGFLSKYPEAQHMYRRMLRASEHVERARIDGHPMWLAARERLHQGQCNCAYWHGLFGGIYAPHLRAATMSALIEAEELVATAAHSPVEAVDARATGFDLVFETPELRAFAKLRGGMLTGLELRRARFCPSFVIGRRPEAYHGSVGAAPVVADDALESVSAHELQRSLAPDLEGKLIFDAYPRGICVDHLLPEGATAEAFERAYEPLVALHKAHHQLVALDPRTGVAELRAELGGVRITKRFTTDVGLEINYRLEPQVALGPANFASQLDVTLLGSEAAHGRRMEVFDEDGKLADAALEPGARLCHERVTRVRLVDPGLRVDWSIVASPPCRLWRLPIETVSQSERGFESIYQGTCLLFVWPIALEVTSKSFAASLAISATATE